MGIFQKHNVIKVDGKAIPKWLKAKLCQSQNYRKSWYVWDILNTCIWIFNMENKCHSIFMKNLLVLNAAHLLLIAMVYILYFLSIFNSCWTLEQLQRLRGGYGFFHIIILFLHFMFSKALTEHSSDPMRINTLCCQYFQMQPVSPGLHSSGWIWCITVPSNVTQLWELQGLALPENTRLNFLLNM